MSEEENKTNATSNALGAFQESLYRNNAKIRRDRADTIIEAAQMKYKREVEDLELELKQLHRELENMLDLSPTNAMNLTLASDFDSKDFVTKDLEIGVRIRNLEIKVEIAKKRYGYLFEGKAL